MSLYPSGAWAAQASTWSQGCDELWERMWASSVDVRGPLVDRLVKACAEHGIHLAIGVNEREDDRPGSLYNTLLVIGAEGVLHRHRKLMPTMHERVFHGVGAGDDLGVVELPGSARVGGLICWENRMPLARWRVYEGGPQIWLAPTADDSDGWIASMRHIAIEAGRVRRQRAPVHPRIGVPRRFSARASRRRRRLRARWRVHRVARTVRWSADRCMTLRGRSSRDCDLREALHAKRYFDAAGHYSRSRSAPPGNREPTRADSHRSAPLNVDAARPSEIGERLRETRGVSDTAVVVLVVLCFAIAVGGFATGLRLVRRVRAESEATNAERDRER